MNKIPIFDSLTHPTLDGNWIRERYDGKNTVEEVLSEMQLHEVRWAFCVGMEGIGSYDEDQYSPFIRSKSPNLFPVAFYSFDSKDTEESNVRARLKGILNKGYIGIKIHPRFSKISLDLLSLRTVIRVSEELNLAVLLCTHFHASGLGESQNDLNHVSKLLSELGDPKVILLHGGTVRLLEMMEIVRPYSNPLLDLSYTLCKYEGSSVDLDLRYIFKTFDQRICIGSDSPEYGLADLRKRFDFFSEGLADEKKENIAYRNLLEFVGLKEERWR